MTARSSRDVSSTRSAFAVRVGRLLFTLLAGWGTLLLGHSGPVQAQQAGGLLIPPGGLVAGEGEKVRALVLDQVKRVPSGSGRDQQIVATRQLLIADLEGQKLYMAEFDRDGHLARHIQVRLDKKDPLVYTIKADGSEYQEHFGDLNTIQHERNIAEANEIKLGNKQPKREREAWFKKHCHLRPDGRRVVDLSLSAGERILDRQCEHLVVKENCLTIIDAQITTAIPGAQNYYHLYRRLGVFSEEVLDRLKDLDGVPLKARINVVTALKRWPLEVETRRMKVQKVPAAFFELPPNAKKYVEEAGSGPCPLCGKEFEKESGVPYIDPNNQKIWLCSEECATKYAVKGTKKPGRSPPKSGVKANE